MTKNSLGWCECSWDLNLNKLFLKPNLFYSWFIYNPIFCILILSYFDRDVFTFLSLKKLYGLQSVRGYLVSWLSVVEPGITCMCLTSWLRGHFVLSLVLRIYRGQIISFNEFLILCILDWSNWDCFCNFCAFK